MVALLFDRDRGCHGELCLLERLPHGVGCYVELCQL